MPYSQRTILNRAKYPALRHLGKVTRLCFPKLTQAVSIASRMDWSRWSGIGSVTQRARRAPTGGPETARDEIDRCIVLRLRGLQEEVGAAGVGKGNRDECCSSSLSFSVRPLSSGYQYSGSV